MFKKAEVKDTCDFKLNFVPLVGNINQLVYWSPLSENRESFIDAAFTKWTSKKDFDWGQRYPYYEPHPCYDDGKSGRMPLPQIMWAKTGKVRTKMFASE